MRNLFENARLFAFGWGTASPTSAAGTLVNGIPLTEARYHTIAWVGTIAGSGTLNIYACTNAAGSNPRIIYSHVVNAGNGAGVAVDIHTQAIGSLIASSGTQYTHLAAVATVGAGSWVGALIGLAHQLRVAPAGTTGLVAGGYGTFLT